MHCPFFLYCEEVSTTLMNYVRALLIMECWKIKPPIDICLTEGPIPPLCPWQMWSIPSQCRSCDLWGSRVVGSKILGKFPPTMLPSLKFNSSRLKIGDWKMNLIFGARLIFRGELLVSGSVMWVAQPRIIAKLHSTPYWHTVPLKKQHVSDILLSEKKRKNHGSLFGSTTGFDRPL